MLPADLLAPNPRPLPPKPAPKPKPRLIVGLALILCLSLGGATVAAQDDCPDELVCVEHEGNVFELNPECGPIIGLIVEERLTRIVSVDDPEGTDRYWVRAIIFVQENPKTYRVMGDVSGNADRFDDARFLSDGCMTWSTADE